MLQTAIIRTLCTRTIAARNFEALGRAPYGVRAAYLRCGHSLWQVHSRGRMINRLQGRVSCRAWHVRHQLRVLDRRRECGSRQRFSTPPALGTRSHRPLRCQWLGLSGALAHRTHIELGEARVIRGRLSFVLR